MKNYGFRHELEKQHNDGTEWKFGAFSPKPLFTIEQRSQRLVYLPFGEVQRGVEDTMDCATRGPINKLEADFTYGVQRKLFSKKNIQWLRDNGYIGEDERVTFSDAFIAIKSGTSRQGNSMKAPLDAIYRYGLVPKKLLPLTPTMTWDEYHDKKRITTEIEDLGRIFSKRFTINYEQVDNTLFKEANTQEMLIVAGYAWQKPQGGIYPRSEGKANHVWVNIRPEYYAFDNYLDTDGDYIKHLAKDFLFYETAYRVFISAENPDVEDTIWSVSALMRLVDKLKKLMSELIKKEEKVEDVTPIKKPTEETNREKLYRIAKQNVGVDVSPRDIADDEVGCAESVSMLLEQVYPNFPLILSTVQLTKILREDINFKATLTLQEGNIIISPTGSGNGMVRGHVGIVGRDSVIMSNTSNNGKWEENYTVDTWVKRWRNTGKMPIYVFEPL